MSYQCIINVTNNDMLKYKGGNLKWKKLRKNMELRWQHFLLTHNAIPVNDNRRISNFNRKDFKEDIEIDVNIYLNLI